MFDFLDNVRKKPERERRRILRISSGASFIVIMALWAVAFSFQLGAREESRQIAEDASSPMQALGQTASAFWSGVGSGVGGSLEKGREAFDTIKTEITEKTN